MHLALQSCENMRTTWSVLLPTLSPDQVELDKIAEQFRRLHIERQELVEQYESTIAQMQRRDRQIDLTAIVSKAAWLELVSQTGSRALQNACDLVHFLLRSAYKQW